jgi:hypothetical protein
VGLDLLGENVEDRVDYRLKGVWRLRDEIVIVLGY